MTRLPRTDPTARCDPKALAAQISTNVGRTVTCDIDGGEVLVYEDLTPTEIPQAQSAIAAYVYDNSAEIEQADFRTEVQTQLAGLDNATKTSGDWTALSVGQRNEQIRLAIRLLIRLVRVAIRRFS